MIVTKKKWNVSPKNNRETNDGHSQTNLCKTHFNFTEPTENLPVSYSSCPDILDICISDDVDLTIVHNSIKTRFVFFIKEYYDLERDGEVLSSEFQNETKESGRERIFSDLENIDCRMNEIKEFLSKWSDYREKSIPILNQYVTIMSDVTRNIKDNSTIIEQRLAHIISYFNVINELDLITLTISYNHDDIATCPTCGNDLNLNNNDEDFKASCECGYYDDSIIHQSMIFGETPKQFVTKTKTKIQKEMEEWLARFLGTTKETFQEKSMFEDFDRVCIEYRWPTGLEVKSGNNSGADLQRLLTIMKLSGHSKFYKYSNIIRHKYWGWALPMMTEEQKHRFIEKVVESQEVYPKHAKRKHNINQNARGWYHLKDVGCDFPKSCLKLPKDVKTLEDADEVYEKICRDCDMKFYAIV